MHESEPTKKRLYVLIGLLAATLAVFFITMYLTQIVHGSQYRAQSISSNATTETVEASRGILTDRNGKVLVSNRLTYTLTFSREGFSDDMALNDAIWRLITLCRSNDTAWTDTLPLSLSAPWRYLSQPSEEQFAAFCKKAKLCSDLSASDAPSAAELFQSLRELFSIDSRYTDAQARLIAGVRYELYSRTSYVFADDASVELLSQVADGHFAGVTTGTSSKRVYNTPYAAHILGRISRIYAEDWDQYSDLGYAMDALVGESGVERAFENYLHATNGTRLITTDTSGRVTGELFTKQPQPGNTVALTIDIDLQAAAEEALAHTITGMIDKDSNERGGAVSVTKVGTGEILALASYPSFDLSQFNEIYSDLLEDERLPMFNRAVNGTYAPGSTFKLCTAVAALESGVITPSSIVVDKGKYTFYDWPQPNCWIYSTTGTTHGKQNVSPAITNSCNYFFYEVGRLTGIETIDDYALQFGLGRSTGVEIGDSSGALASPEYAQSHDLDWTEGQTITAAIGQSYHLFTPLQLSNYIATLVGGGEHYTAHLLKNVKSYDNRQLLYVYDAAPENTVEISDVTLNAITEGMHDLTTGSLAGAFNQCVVSAGAKTGSAQVGTEIANGVFVAYAPYENPEIAVAIVIEKGGSGAALASTAVEIINAYFTNDAWETAALGENILVP